nr:hypothetical protein TetV2_00177 [Oceanusvirus sp.]
MFLFDSTVRVLACCAEADDLPPVVIVGCGTLHERRAAANAALDELVDALSARERSVAIRASARDPELSSRINETASFDTSMMHRYRQICCARDLDMAPLDVMVAVTRAAFRTPVRWWILSVASLNPLPPIFGSGALTVIARGAADLVRSCVKTVDIACRADVASAVKSGAPLDVITRAYWEYAAARLPADRAADLAAELDTTLKRNRRPLLLTALVEHAVDDADREAAQASFSALSTTWSSSSVVQYPEDDNSSSEKSVSTALRMSQ